MTSKEIAQLYLKYKTTVSTSNQQLKAKVTINYRVLDLMGRRQVLTLMLLPNMQNKREIACLKRRMCTLYFKHKQSSKIKIQILIGVLILISQQQVSIKITIKFKIQLHNILQIIRIKLDKALTPFIREAQAISLAFQKTWK